MRITELEKEAPVAVTKTSINDEASLACQESPELFHKIPSPSDAEFVLLSSPARERVAKRRTDAEDLAIAACNTCPLQKACAEFAADKTIDGVVAGTRERERSSDYSLIDSYILSGVEPDAHTSAITLLHEGIPPRLTQKVISEIFGERVLANMSYLDMDLAEERGYDVSVDAIVERSASIVRNSYIPSFRSLNKQTTDLYDHLLSVDSMTLSDALSFYAQRVPEIEALRWNNRKRSKEQSYVLKVRSGRHDAAIQRVNYAIRKSEHLRTFIDSNGEQRVSLQNDVAIAWEQWSQNSRVVDVTDSRPVLENVEIRKTS